MAIRIFVPRDCIEGVSLDIEGCQIFWKYHQSFVSWLDESVEYTIKNSPRLLGVEDLMGVEVTLSYLYQIYTPVVILNRIDDALLFKMTWS